MAEISEDALLADLERRLQAIYTAIPSSDVADTVQKARQRFDQSTIRDFVPLLVERRVRAELAATRSLITS